MAISGVTLRGEIGGRGGLSLAVSPTVAIAVGKIAFAACVADNSGTTDGATTFHTLTDTDGHTWTRLWEETETDGAASDGVSQSLWATVVTSEIGTGDSVTFGSPDAGAANARVLALFEATFSGGAGFALENKALARGTEEVTLGSLPSREYLLIHFSGAEGEDNAATADADYTALTTLRSGTTGASDTNVCMHLAVRVATLTTDTATSTLFTSVTNLLTSLTAVYEPAGAGPQTIAVGKASETETAKTVSVAGATSITVTKANETETAKAVAAVAVINVSVGTATETESANPVTVTAGGTSVAVGTATETETASAVAAVTGAVTISVGVATETETAQIVEPVAEGGPQSITVAVALELETAKVVSVLGAITVAVGAASETESAVAVTVGLGATLVAVGVATETETAYPITVSQTGVTFWEPNPAGFTRNPAAYVPVGANDDPPW